MNAQTTKKQPTHKPQSKSSSPRHTPGRPASKTPGTHGSRVQSPRDSIASKSSPRKSPRGKKERRRQTMLRIILFVLILLFLVLSAAVIQRIIQAKKFSGKSRSQEVQETEGKIPRPELDVDLLTVNEYSRPGIPLKEVKGIVIHYTANPGTSAAANRDYFEGLKDSHVTKASSHFVIGLKGEIIQCIPSSEIAYASNGRNKDTVSIECCIKQESGKFEKATYDSAVHLTAWLAERFGLGTEDVIRHYDVTGKACPKYFVDFPSAWEQFLADVEAYLVSYGVF